jgi:hypothetical protein
MPESRAQVTGCDDCPLEWQTPQGKPSCLHPDSPPVKPYRSGVHLPTWCPLRKGPVTVELKEGDDGE